MHLNQQYLQAQFLALAQEPIEPDALFRIQLRADDGGYTNWLNIGRDELQAIEKILLQGVEG